MTKQRAASPFLRTILENHAPLRTFLEQQGIPFRSDTDTESLVQLIGHFLQQTGDFEARTREC